MKTQAVHNQPAAQHIPTPGQELMPGLLRKAFPQTGIVHTQIMPMYLVNHLTCPVPQFSPAALRSWLESGVSSWLWWLVLYQHWAEDQQCVKPFEVCQHNLISKSVFPFRSDPSDPASAYLCAAHLQHPQGRSKCFTGALVFEICSQAHLDLLI